MDFDKRPYRIGQASLEFMALTGILLLVVALVASVSLSSSRSIFDENVNTDAKRVAELVATEINIAAEVGDGYSHKFFIPEKIHGQTNYTFGVSSHRVFVYWDVRSYSLPILANNVSGSITKGDVTVYNTGGVISFD